ncbi:MAG: cupredoxin family protein [Usitatibacteraceae bacterium]
MRGTELIAYNTSSAQSVHPLPTLHAKHYLALLTVCMLVVFCGATHAHDAPHKKEKQAAIKKEQNAWGIAGEARSISRNIDIAMTDAMRFSPDNIGVKLGGTIRFRVKNDGAMLHEMVIGTKQVLDEHAALMLRFPDMEHDEPYMVHVPPGKSGEIIWTFNRAGNFEFACLIAGHYQAGMKGSITVKSK